MSQTAVAQIGELTVVTLGDTVNVASAASVRHIFSALLNDGHRRLIIDLSKVETIDSSGLGVLIELLKKIRVGEGELRVAGIPSHLQVVFELTHLDQVFRIYSNTDEAIAA